MNIKSLRRLLAGLLLCPLTLLTGCTAAGGHRMTDDLQADTDVTKGVLINPTMARMREQAEDFSGFDPADADTVISPEDLGLIPDDRTAAKKNAELLNAAIRRAKEGSAILMDSGIYYIDPVQIKGKRRLALVGKDTVLINTAYDPKTKEDLPYPASTFFFISGCEDLTLSGLCLDYDAHTCCDGKIESVGGGYTVIRPFAEFLSRDNCPMDKRPLTGGEFPFCVNLFDDMGVPADEWYLDLSKGDVLEAAGDGLFRFPGEYGKAGQTVSLRFSSGSVTPPSIIVQETKGLTVSNVTVHSSPSAVVYAPCGNADFRFDGFSVYPAEGSKALFGANVDCVHVKGLRGKLILQNGTFRGLGDDVLNVHSRAGIVSEPEGNTFRVLDGWDKDPMEDLWCAVGDTLEFFDAAERSVGCAAVTAYRRGNVTVDALPDTVIEGCTVWNASYAPFTVVENCTVSRGRARGFLFQTKNALVRNNTIRDMRLPAVIVSPDFDYWYEAGFADNLLIENNTFENVCRAPQCMGYGAILIAGCHDLKDIPAAGITPHKNISVVGNTFTDIRAAGVYVRAAANFMASGNTFSSCRAEIREMK